MNGSLARVPFQEMIYSPISSSFKDVWQNAVSFGVLVKVMKGQRCFGMKNSSPWIIEILLVSVPTVRFSFNVPKRPGTMKMEEVTRRVLDVQLQSRTMQDRRMLEKYEKKDMNVQHQLRTIKATPNRHKENSENLLSMPEKISASKKARLLLPADEKPEMATVKGCGVAMVATGRLKESNKT
jgi:hypothetical protein